MTAGPRLREARRGDRSLPLKPVRHNVAHDETAPTSWLDSTRQAFEKARLKLEEWWQFGATGAQVCDALRQHAADLEAERNSLKQHAANLQQDRDSLRQHAANLEHELASLQQHVVNLEHERDSLRAYAADLEKDRDSIRDHARQTAEHARNLEREHRGWPPLR
jgi:chromosome segregation ATPase